MSDALTTDIVAAVTSSATKSLVDGGSAALVRLVGALRERFRRQPAARGALELALENPDDPRARQALIDLLDEFVLKDPGFAQQLHDLWADSTTETATAAGSATNIIGGSVEGSVVQARDVHGGITIGRAIDPRRD